MIISVCIVLPSNFVNESLPLLNKSVCHPKRHMVLSRCGLNQITRSFPCFSPKQTGVPIGEYFWAVLSSRSTGLSYVALRSNKQPAKPREFSQESIYFFHFFLYLFVYMFEIKDVAQASALVLRAKQPDSTNKMAAFRGRFKYAPEDKLQSTLS